MKKLSGFKYIFSFLIFMLLLAAGGCEQAAEQQVAEVDLKLLMEESEIASDLQQEFVKRENDFADYYQQLDIGGPETGEQYSVYQRYKQMTESKQQELDELIAQAIESLGIEEEFTAVVTASTAYKVSEDITLQVAEEIDNLQEEAETPKEDEGENSHEQTKESEEL